MSITSTLSELKDLFISWHKNEYDILHKEKTETLIQEKMEEADVSDIGIIKNKIITVAKNLSLRLDGETSNITDINQIDNEFTSKNNEIGNLNLKALDSRITANSTSINNLNTNKVDKAYVTEVVNEAMTDVGSNHTHNQINTQEIASNTDLNTITTAGIYRCKTSAIANTLQNNPYTGAAFNLVTLLTQDGGIRQLFLVGNASNDGNKIYTRNYANSKWSEWYELYGTHNTSTFQMEVEFSNGSKSTYTILQK